MNKNDKIFLLDHLKTLPTENKILLPSELANQVRYMPRSTTEHPGNFNILTVPYLKEPLDCCHPDNPVTNITIMKSVQSAATVTVAENAMLFFTYYMLGSVAYYTSSHTVGRIRTSSSLDVLIDNTPLHKMLKPLSDRSIRKTADTALYKEIGLSKWLISSYGSMGDMKSNTFQLIIADEFDECPPELKDQGDIAGILEGRTMGTKLYKIYAISTPTRLETSRIYKNYIEGDQRKYKVPCPYCGEYQVLTLKRRGRDYGLTFSTIESDTKEKTIDPKSIRYICISCKREIFENQKYKMLLLGHWEATWQNTEFKPVSQYHRSYSVNGLMSPFLSWERLLTQFKKTEYGKDILAYKDYTINYLGEPYTQTQRQAGWELFKTKANNYELGTPPTDLKHNLLLYGGVDIQGDRIEIGVYGFYYGMEMYLIDYQTFSGDPSNLQDDCWKKLFDFVYKKSYQIQGKARNIIKAAIDSGWDPKHKRQNDWTSKANTIIAFCATTLGLCIPVKGVPDDERNTSEVIKGVRSYNPLVPTRFNINVSLIKDLIYSSIELIDGAGAIHFPKWGGINNKFELSDHYFQSFLSETFKEDKDGRFNWVKHYMRNEVLDTAVYAIGLYFLDNLNLKPLNFFQYLDSR